MPLTNLGTDVFGQASRGLIGDPTVGSGAGLTDLSSLRRVAFQPQFGRQIITNEGDQMLTDGASGWTRGVQIVITMFSAAAAKLAALMPEITASGDDLDFRNSVATLSPPTLIIVPETEYGSAASSSRVWYFPAVVMTQDPGQLIYKIENNLASGEPFDVTLNALVRTQDQASVALADGKQLMFRGDKPAGWSFPAGY